MPRAQGSNLDRARRRVFLVGKHLIFRQVLEQFITAEKDLQVCGSTALGEAAIEQMRRIAPDLALIDLTLPSKSGIELIKGLRAADSKAKVLVMSMNKKPGCANQALRAGGDGYVLKYEEPQEIITAIRDVLSGRIYVSEEVIQAESRAARAVKKTRLRSLSCLSDSELDVVQLLGQGKSDQEIANQLGPASQRF